MEFMFHHLNYVTSDEVHAEPRLLSEALNPYPLR